MPGILVFLQIPRIKPINQVLHRLRSCSRLIKFAGDAGLAAGKPVKQAIPAVPLTGAMGVGGRAYAAGESALIP